MKPLGYLLLPVGILIGWAFGLLFQSPSTTSVAAPSADRPPAPSLNLAAAPQTGSEITNAASVASPGPVGRSGELSSAAIESSVRAALASAPRPRPSSATREGGSGTIRGSVTTLAGAPLSGVQVRLSPLTADAQRLAQRVVTPGIQSASESLADQARRLLDSDARAIFGATGDDGNFALAVEQERVYSVALSLPGWRFERTDGHSSSLVAGAELNYLASPLSSLVLDLVDQAGQPIDAAVLAYTQVLRGYDSWSFVAWSRAQPRLEFSAGTYRIIALSADAEPWCPDRACLWLASSRSQSQELTLSASGEPRSERWELKPQPTLYGRLTLAAAEPRLAEGFGLALVTPGNERPERSDFGDGYSYFESPHFLLTREEAGGFDLRLKWRGAKEDQLLGRVELPQGNLRQDFSIEARAEKPKLFVTAKDPTGQPVESLGSIMFLVRGSSNNRSSSGGSGMLMVGPGRFELRVPEGIQEDFYRCIEDSNSGVQASCNFTHPTYGSRTLEMVAGQREYELQFQEPSTLTVQISGATPADDEHFYQLIITETGNTSGWSRGNNSLDPKIGAAGTWSGTFKDIQPGEYQVALYYNEGSPNSYSPEVLMTLPTTVVSGANNFNFDLNLLSDLRVRVADGEGDYLFLQAHRDENDPFSGQRHAEIGEDGLAVFSKVAPGEYLLNYNNSFMLVTCPCGEVAFTPNSANCVKVSIWDEGSDMYRAGLRNGDLITAVDGAAFDSQAWREAIQKKAPERDLRLSVRRNGRTVQVTVPNRTLSDNDGGYCQESYAP
jgi:hypothetical protein